MFCDFCGKKLSYNIKYCRYCGQQLKSSLDDTQPLPVIDKAMLYSAVRPPTTFTSPPSWYRSMIPQKPFTKRSRLGRIVYDLFSIVVTITLLYILATFKTVREYQGLTGLWGGILLIYILWKR